MARILVAGAGNGGFAVAVHLTLLGWEVSLYNRSAETLIPVQEAGGIRYTGCLGEGFARLKIATTDMAEAIAGAEAVLITAPATAHRFLARALAGLLTNGQIVVLNPGGLLGSLAFRQELDQLGCSARIDLAETGTMTHICRKSDPGAVHITSCLQNLPFAALPAKATVSMTEKLRGCLPTLAPCSDVLEAGLGNVNAILHPPAMVLGAAWIEATGGDFHYYYDTAVPSVGALMAAMDQERLAVAAAWGVKVASFPTYFASIGSTTREAAQSGDYSRMLRESHPNRFIKAPPSLDHRYFHEDIPFGVVPLTELGRLAGVATPVLDAVITLTSTVSGRDYRQEGRNLRSLGLDGLTQDEALKLLREGRL